MDYKKKLETIINTACDEKVSDIHISAGHNPIFRIAGNLTTFSKIEVLQKEDTEGIAKELMTEEQFGRFFHEKEIDFSYNYEDKARFRVNIFFQRGNISCALRFIETKIKTVEELMLPPIFHNFIKYPQGFFLITGPSGQGKSTTLAAMIDEINNTRSEHIITIEDPIEYIFEPKKSIIDQREVYQDTLSFAKALKSTFREDPDVIMVGEMRDPETISTAITAAETGHLVFATLHTNSASQTIHRIVDSFPAEQQTQIRAQLSGSLIAVISQRLVPRIKGGLMPACEIMINNTAVSNLIRENKIHEIPLTIGTSAEAGMISLNRYLANLVRIREVDLDTAMSFSLNPAELKSFLKK